LKVSIIGTGYVGLVTGACLADSGHQVLCLDVDAGKIERLLQGIIPIYEPGLDSIVERCVKSGRLSFTTDAKAASEFGVIQVIAVGTPPDEDGSADLKYVIEAARQIGRYMPSYRVVVDKSTVPVGTGDLVEAALAEELLKRKSDLEFAVVSNPEFLKEGAAVEDFMKPDRIVFGVDDNRAETLMRELYAPFQRNHDRVVVMSRRSSELTKYAANAMLATRISFMNELALLAETLGADIEDVRRGIGSDPRIGFSFLYSGTGYGGSCFPKDVKALIQSGAQNGHDLKLLTAVEAVNDTQKSVLVEKINRRFGSPKGAKIAIWGLSFKPNTDDMREAPSITVVHELLKGGAELKVYDPVAMEEAKRVIGIHPGLTYCESSNATLEDADYLVILTEWKEFRSPDFDLLRAKLRKPVIFDGRNMYDPLTVHGHGFEYFGIGRGDSVGMRK
jgi:UDPglucose 6-dehydrogenase